MLGAFGYLCRQTKTTAISCCFAHKPNQSAGKTRTEFFDMEPTGYLPVIMQSLVALGFVALVLIVVPRLGPRRSSKKKDENFECGIESQGNARIPVSIKYLMTAILFVLFDVEVIFFYPYAVNFRAMGTAGFFAVLMFVAVFLVGFYYVLRKGAFEWDK